MDLDLDTAIPVASARQAILAVTGIHDRMVAAALDALEATKWSWDREANARVYEPDHKARMEALKWLSAYGDGLPMQTTFNVNVGDGPKGEAASLEEAVERSPALRERLARLASAKRVNAVETGIKTIAK